jgi:hypothetical protein
VFVVRLIAILLAASLNATLACTGNPSGSSSESDSGSDTDSDSDTDADSDIDTQTIECQELTDEETCLWCQQASGTDAELLGVWGAASDDVFAVGSGGTIIHYNGTEWSPMDSGTSAQLNSVWGSGTDDVYAVGQDCVILHYDGGGWSPMEAPECGQLWDVWGSSPQDVLAVGEGPESDPYSGIIIRFDGDAWSEEEVEPFNAPQYGAWGSAANDVYVAGGVEMGTVLHFDGNEWTMAFTQDTWHSGNACRSVWGTKSGEVFVGGDEPVCLALHYDGETWESFGEFLFVFDMGINDVAGSTASSVFSVGWVLPHILKSSKSNSFIAVYDGEGWDALPVGWCYDELFSIWVASETEAFAVGTEGLIVHYSDSA